MYYVLLYNVFVCMYYTMYLKEKRGKHVNKNIRRVVDLIPITFTKCKKHVKYIKTTMHLFKLFSTHLNVLLKWMHQQLSHHLVEF